MAMVGRVRGGEGLEVKEEEVKEVKESKEDLEVKEEESKESKESSINPSTIPSTIPSTNPSTNPSTPLLLSSFSLPAVILPHLRELLRLVCRVACAAAPTPSPAIRLLTLIANSRGDPSLFANLVDDFQLQVVSPREFTSDRHRRTQTARVL